MKIKLYILFLITPVLFITSCYKDQLIKDDTKVIQKDHTVIETSGNLVGIITNESGIELTGLSSEIGSSVNDNDESAYYHFIVNGVNQNATYLTVAKGDNLYEFTLKPLNNEVSYFRHTIFSDTETKNVTTSEAFQFTFSDKNKIEFKALSYRLNDQLFSGTFSPKAFIPDLQNPIHLLSIPGGHLANDEEGHDLWLDYHNVISISLESINGTKLEIEKDKGSVQLGTNGCINCSVWRYDTNQQQWIIHKTDIIGTIAEFGIETSGYYAIAKSHPYNLVEGSIESNGTTLRNQTIDIYSSDRLIDRIYTTNTGRWFTHLPVDNSFSAKIQLNTESINIFDIASENEDLTLETFEINNPNISFVSIVGEVKDCNNDILDQHFMEIWQDDKPQYIFFNEKNVDVNIVNNSSDKIKIRSADESWENIGPVQKFKAVDSDLDFSVSYSCNGFIDGYFNLKIDGVEKKLTGSTYLNNNKTVIELINQHNLKLDFSFSFEGNQTRSYNDNEVNIWFENLELGEDTYSLNCKESNEGCGMNEFHISYYGSNKGNWIKGKFKGLVYVKSTKTNTALYKDIEAEFLVPRNF